MTAAVFLDRDGTLIDEVGYLDRPDRIALYPWSIDAIRTLNRVGIRIIMVSNQSGIARGFFTEEKLAEIHDHLAALLAAGGAHLDGYTIVRTIRMVGLPRSRRCATAASPVARWSNAPSRSSASIRGSRSPSAIDGWMSPSPAPLAPAECWFAPATGRWRKHGRQMAWLPTRWWTI